MTHIAYMRDLQWRIRWLDRGREHWWIRELRWHRELYPDCQCRACTYGPG